MLCQTLTTSRTSYQRKKERKKERKKNFFDKPLSSAVKACDKILTVNIKVFHPNLAVKMK